MKKLVIITGQTGTGKSDFAINIAKKINGEIISADSVQIYKGLDIGSAKISNTQMQGVLHHLIDIIEPTESYSVGQFVKDCQQALIKIAKNNKIPIIVGGTGLYIKALLEGYNFGGSEADNKLRTQLAELAEEKGNLHLWNMLKSMSPQMAEKVHFNNVKRVIRYIELLKDKSIFKAESVIKNYKVLTVALVQDRQKLYPKLEQRVDIMLKKGLFKEVKTLLDSGLPANAQSLNSIGYKEIVQHYANNVLNRQDTINLIKQHTRNYAKRQQTFLKTIKNINFFDAEQTELAKKVILNFIEET